jgi:hypothetical protein
MLGWIKKLYKRYKRFTMEQYDLSPVVYRIGTKRYIKKKQFSKNPVPRTRYEK